MSQNIWRPVDYEFLNSQPDITLEEDQMEDIVVISDEDSKDNSKMSLASGEKIFYNFIFFNWWTNMKESIFPVKSLNFLIPL